MVHQKLNLEVTLTNQQCIKLYNIACWCFPKSVVMELLAMSAGKCNWTFKIWEKI